MTLRLTSSSLAGTSRKLVAVGTSRLASMFVDDAGRAPRRGSGSVASAAAAAASTTALEAAAGVGSGDGFGVSGDGRAGRPPGRPARARGGRAR